ncbi:acyl-CoA synthetase [Gordonia insulae]|uniref:Long-chain-fatty-acid--CoA ligase n=1 Tax=Gordonia insulae TaxID=2420509 RepID=A0A3G8JSG6_9ACTN|nr:long-chain fatty acid--CoA ligase [Gordonia insulae]AZG47120.1 Long-chain-fatty-acid--CoA ligase [Gordonia insulae]
MYLTQPLHRNVQLQPDAIATICGDRSFTFAEMCSQVASLAGGVRELGVESGDRVAILSLNSDRYMHMIVAVAWADAVIVPVNTRWSTKEIAYSLVEADVRVLVVDDAFSELVGELRSQCPDLDTVVHCGDGATPAGMVSYAQIAGAEPIPDARRGGDELAGIFYTGGTTGFPKGVMLSHRNLFASAMGSAASGAWSTRGRVLHVAPMFHLADLASTIGHMLLGGTHVIIPGFDPVATMTAIAEQGVTDVLLVPTMIQMTVDHPRLGDFDLSGLQVLMYGASPISEALLERARSAFPSARFLQAYGMTELSPVATLLTDDDHRDPVRRRSAGQAAPQSLVKIFDLDGNEVPRGDFGEIVVSGEHVMLGYWKKPDETAGAVRDGWMHTGDGGIMDDAGYVFVADRIKDMIISGGENVYSIEVENVIAKHPSVLQCAVIGVPDDQWGERVHAVVSLKPGATLSLDELREHSKAEIAGYKVPRSLEIVEAFPMSGAGKILKRELRKATV